MDTTPFKPKLVYNRAKLVLILIRTKQVGDKIIPVGISRVSRFPNRGQIVVAQKRTERKTLIRVISVIRGLNNR